MTQVLSVYSLYVIPFYMFEAFEPAPPRASSPHHTRHRLTRPALSIKGQKVPIEKQETVNPDRESFVEGALYCKPIYGG